MSDNTKVTIIVDGLGKQEINLTKKDATAIYIAASQGIIDKLLTKDKPEHSCSCGGSCQSQSNEDSRRGSREYTDKTEGTLLVGYAEKGPDMQPMNTTETDPIQNIRSQVIKEFNDEADNRIMAELNDKPVMGCRIPHYNKSTIDMEEKPKAIEDLPFYDCESNPFADNDLFKNKKLIMYRCVDCGRVTARNLVLADTNITSCHWCKEPVEINEAVLAEIQCDGCNKNHAFIYVANGITEIDCKNCEAPIDITYYQDGSRKKAKSVNLV